MSQSRVWPFPSITIMTSGERNRNPGHHFAGMSIITSRLIIVLIVGLSLWIVYGVGKNDIVIIIGNLTAVSLNTYLLFLKIKYSKKPLEEEST